MKEKIDTILEEHLSVTDEWGLLVPSTTGTVLFKKKKAQHRDVEIPEDIWRYILMSRTTVKTGEYRKRSDLEFWQGWPENKTLSYDVGMRVSKELGFLIKNKIEAEAARNNRLEKEVKRYAEVREFMEKLNIIQDVGKKVEQLRSGIQKGFSARLNSTIGTLSELVEPTKPAQSIEP